MQRTQPTPTKQFVAASLPLPPRKRRIPSRAIVPTGRIIPLFLRAWHRSRTSFTVAERVRISHRERSALARGLVRFLLSFKGREKLPGRVRSGHHLVQEGTPELVAEVQEEGRMSPLHMREHVWYAYDSALSE